MREISGQGALSMLAGSRGAVDEEQSPKSHLMFSA